VCDESNTEVPLKSTGIPPHVTLMKRMKKLEDKMMEYQEEINKNINKVCSDVMEELEKRSVNAGHVTNDGLQERLLETLRMSGLLYHTPGCSQCHHNQDCEDALKNENTPRFYNLLQAPMNIKIPKGCTVQ
jgi:hypothetical protein